MNPIDIANGLVFQKLSIEKETFDDRLISQKKIYLLQSLGTDLGYTYHWYVRGPYSSSLASYLYANLDILSSSDFHDYYLTDTAERNVQSVRGLEHRVRPDFTTASWYELLASLLYIYNNKESWKINDQEHSLFSKLIQYKSQYNEEQCQYAFGVLCSEGFVKAGS